MENPADTDSATEIALRSRFPVTIISCDLRSASRLRELSRRLVGIEWIRLSAVVWDAQISNSVPLATSNATFIESNANLGYCEAIHRALPGDLGEASPVIVMNPDIAFDPEQLAEFCSRWLVWDETSGQIAGGPSIIFPSIRTDGVNEKPFSFNSAPRQALEFLVGESYGRSRSKGEPRWSSGCFFLTTAGVLRLHLPRGDFFLYAEDLAFCKSAADAGIPSIFDNAFTITHERGFSPNQTWKQLLAILGIAQTFPKRWKRPLLFAALLGTIARSLTPSRWYARAVVWPLMRMLIGKNESQMQYALRKGWAVGDQPVVNNCM